MAYVEAARITAQLLKRGYKVYSPIAHTHPIAIYGNVDPYDHNIWLPFDKAMMDRCDALLVATLPGWSTSTGVKFEMKTFVEQSKPVYFYDPKTEVIV